MVELLNAANKARTALSGAITATATSFSVEDASSFPKPPFAITVEDEIMEVGTVSGNTFSNVTRGLEGTVAVAHEQGAPVENRFTAGTYNRMVDSFNEQKVKVIKVEQELNNFKTTLQQININQEAKQKVSGYDIITIPKNAAEGQVSDVVIKGLTATNIINNGNFANGTSGWLRTNATISVSNNIMQVVPDGSASTGWLVQNTSYPISPSKKYFIKAKLRVTNNDCVIMRALIRSTGGSGDSYYTITAPVANQWYSLAIILDSRATHAGNFRLLFSHEYADAATANGKIMEVQEVMVIDLTAHGLENKTYEELNQMFPHWFDGTKSTLNARLVSVGKNLFDKNKIITGYVITIAGSQYKAQGNYAVTPFIKVTPNTQYYYNQGYPSGTTRRAYYTSNKELISTESPERGVFLTPPNTSYVRTSLKLDVINIDTYQIEPGTTATEYEPYKESIAYINGAGELRSLPNGVKDEVNLTTGVKTQRIGIKENVASGTVINYADMATDGQFVAYFADGTSQTGVKGDTLTALATTLTYQLAMPVETPVQVSGTLVSYPSGTVYIEPFVADAGIYTDKMEVLYSDLPIKALEKISKVDFGTGLETELDITAAVIAEDKLSFTHPDLTSGDIVFFVYEYGAEGTIPETEISYYDSRYVIKGEDDKFYKWEIEAKLVEGVITPSIKLVEV